MENPTAGERRPPGKVVRALRTKLGLTQEQLAERAGILRTVVAKVETGRNHVTSYALRTALARGFGLSLEELDAMLDEKAA